MDAAHTAIGEPLSRKKNVESQLHTPLPEPPMADRLHHLRLDFRGFTAKGAALLGQRAA
jgi:hypothetical protein